LTSDVNWQAFNLTAAAIISCCVLPAGAFAVNPHTTTTGQTTSHEQANPPSTTTPPGQTKTKPPPATPAPAPAGSGKQLVHGVVQSVKPALVVVRQLDGTAVSVPYGKKTHVFVDGKLGKIDEVKTGYVLTASWKAGAPAVVLRFLH
jgi:hypothetical protein